MSRQISSKCIVVHPAIQELLRALRVKAETASGGALDMLSDFGHDGVQATGRRSLPGNGLLTAGGKRKSLFRGVEPNGATGWAAELIAKDGIRHYCGTYPTEEEAARAFDKKALEVRGPTARLNFPDPNQLALQSASPAHSKYLGVYPKSGRHEVRLSSQMLRGTEGHGSANFMLGSYENELEAARAYDEVAGPLGRRVNGVTWGQACDPALLNW